MYVPGAAAMIALFEDRELVRLEVDDSVELNVPSRTVGGKAAQLTRPPMTVTAATAATTRPNECNCPRYGMWNCGRKEVRAEEGCAVAGYRRWEAATSDAIPTSATRV